MTEIYILMMMGVVFFLKKMVIKRYNAKYQKTYWNWYYVLKKDFIKDTIIRRTYSGRKQRASGYVYPNGLLYLDAEGLS